MKIRNGDLIGVIPTGFLPKLICRVVGATTFHWAIVIGQDKDGYILSESIGKGTAVTRLVTSSVLVYRIKALKHEPETYRMVSLHSQRGEAVYDMQANFLAGIWFLLKHYLKIAVPRIKNNAYNCQEWVIYMAYMLGHKVIPENEYPYCKNLENSDALEYQGVSNGGAPFYGYP